MENEVTEIIETDKERISIQLEDGAEVSCQIVMIFRINDQKYIVLIPEGDTSDGKGYLLRFSLDSEGGPVLDNIENEEEYAHASEVFHQLFDDGETDHFSFEE